MFNFPDSPAPGTIFTDAASGAQYIFNNGVWMQSSAAQISLGAPDKNLVDNGSFQVNQYVTDAIVVAGACCDRWVTSMAGLSGYSSTRAAAQGIIPRTGTLLRLQSTLKGSLAAGDYMSFYQSFEGFRMKHLQFGNAMASPLVARFSLYTDKAGTYSLTLRNADATRCYVKNFTVAAGDVNKAVDYEIAIPGCTDGVWPVTYLSWGTLLIAFVSGSTFTAAVDGVWNTSNMIAGPGISNGSGGNFYISNIGLYLDQQNTKKAPPYAPGDFADELEIAKRYWQKSFNYEHTPGTATQIGSCGWTTFNGAAGRMTFDLDVEMRTTPTVAWYATKDGASGVISGSDNVNYTAVNLSTGAKHISVSAPSVVTTLTVFAQFTCDARL